MIQEKAKNLLFNFSNFSPEKAFVSCQINRWEETKKKSQSPVKQQRIVKTMPTKNLILDENNINTLKRRRQELLKSSGKKVRRSSQTKPSSSTATPGTVRRLVENLPMIKVSQFNPSENQKNSIKQIFYKNQDSGWMNDAKRKNTKRKYSTRYANKQIQPFENNFQNRVIIKTADLLHSHSQQYCGIKRLRKNQLMLNKKLIIN